MSNPIKFLGDNLIFKTNGDVYAYYEFFPFNYSFVSEDRASQLANYLERLVSQCQSEHFRFYFCSTEESISDTIERSKRMIKGDLKDLADNHLDGVKDILEEMNGQYELTTRFFIGFKLTLDSETSKHSFLDDVKMSALDFLSQFNSKFLGDFYKIPKIEYERYQRSEYLLFNRISKHFSLRKTEPKDIAYIIKHLNGQKDMAFSDSKFYQTVESDKSDIKSLRYDYLKLETNGLEEFKRHIEIDCEERKEYVSYLALSSITGENFFPFGSEILYYQQSVFDFPVDVSLDIRTIPNKTALAKIRNKKADMKDVDESSMISGHDAGLDLMHAREDADELEEIIERTRENIYKMSLVIRVSATSHDELLKRVNEVIDFYDSYKMILQRPLGDQVPLHYECFPAGTSVIPDFVQYVRADFISKLGFGATQQLGDDCGIPIGFNVDTGKTIYIQPWLAAQGVQGSVTNALAQAYLGSLGGGKSVLMNLLVYWLTLFGAKNLIIDPKGERINWIKDLDFLGDSLNVVNITSDESNRGLLDPFIIMDNQRDVESLALNILTFITGIHAQDSDKFPILQKAVKTVALNQDSRSMMKVIDELAKGDEISVKISEHIQSFTELSIAGLLFGNGEKQKTLQLDKSLNVVLVQDLVLPDPESEKEMSTSELISIAIMLVLSTFSLDFIKQNRELFKFLGLDESWAWLNVSEGKTLSNKLVRAGRSMNAGIGFGTQNTDDLGNEKMKNNIGMKFAFRSTDKEEIRKTLDFFGLDYTDDNVARITGLKNGECLFQDIKGRVGVLYVYYFFDDLFKAFDTRPPVKEIEVIE